MTDEQLMELIRKNTYSNVDALMSPPILRWNKQRKLQVLRALARDKITLDQVSENYDIARAEIEEWATRYDQFGGRGLNSTKIQRVGRLRDVDKRIY